MPRRDLLEILYRFDGEIAADSKTKQDINDLDMLLMPVEEAKQYSYRGKIDFPLKLFPHQEEYVRLPKWMYRTILCFKTGQGKCLGLGTPVIMYDGTIRKVEDVKVGDLLMGPDSMPRRVKSLARGRERMYRVNPVKGDSWTCNESHILSLKWTSDHGKIVNMTVKDYLKQDGKFKHEYKLYRPDGIKFQPLESKLLIDPYFLGTWLGDGSSRTTAITNPDPEVIKYIQDVGRFFDLKVRLSESGQKNGKCFSYHLTTGNIGHVRSNDVLDRLRFYNLIGNKHIPHEFLTASKTARLRLLAGLLDTDGYLLQNVYEITQKSKVLADQILFLCRSLGLAAYVTEERKACTYKGEKRWGTYHRIRISGDVDAIPCRVERKKAAPRQQIKSVLVTGFKLEDLGEGDYYGFELEGPDRLFMLGDFTVTHNTVSSLARAKRLGYKKLLIVTIGAVIEDWEEEVLANLNTDPLVYLGTIKQRANLLGKFDNYEVVIATYESVHELHLSDFDSFIFDECDVYANTETQRWERLRELWRATGPLSRKIPVQQLTATPVGNQPVSVWPLLWLVHPWLAGTKESFKERFHDVQRQIERRFPYTTGDGTVKWYKKKIDTNVKLANKEQLRERLAACLFTFTGKKEFDFEDSERIVQVSMTERQAQVYEELKEELLSQVGGRRTIKIKDGFSKLTRLLQCAEGLLNFDEEYEESGKLEYLIPLVERCIRKKQKLVIWGRFKKMGQVIHDMFPEHSVLYNGDMSRSKRALAKWSFNGIKSARQEDKFNEYARNNAWVFKPGEALIFNGIIHSKTSRGMNLQAGAYQVFSSFSFSAYAMEQTKGRLTRIGQLAKIVKTRYLVSEQTWEAKCLAYVLSKRLDAQALIKGTLSADKNHLSDLIDILRAA